MTISEQIKTAVAAATITRGTDPINYVDIGKEAYRILLNEMGVRSRGIEIPNIMFEVTPDKKLHVFEEPDCHDWGIRVVIGLDDMSETPDELEHPS
jgi:hypothetical protein